MKIELFDIQEFIELNHLEEVTSAVLFQRGGIPHPNGLISNEIFGITTKSRKETFAYINLHAHFFHPHIYKVLKRLYRNIEKIVNGDLYVTINADGKIVPDENGETGIDYLYNNWSKIKWEYSIDPGMRNERIELITKTKKNEIFTQYCIVIPAFYRDISYDKSGGGQTGDINQLYCKLIRAANLVKDKNMFDFQFNSTNYNIQSTLVEIYDYFKTKLEKKQGLLRKYLLGRNVDYCTRVVITAPTFHAERPEHMMTDFRHAAIPISHICSLCFPFMMHWVKTFFERYVIDAQLSKILYDPNKDAIEGTAKLKDPELYFNEKFYKKMIDTYVKDPESRFNKIEIPIEGGKTKYLAFEGTRLDPSNKAELATIGRRPLTWTDILYMAAYDVTKDKCCLVTRYPLLDEFGIFLAEIRVLSTTETEVVQYNGTVYEYYPHIDFDVPHDKMATKFIDSVQFSNSYLPGLDGDYDGDQTTIKIAFTQEANEECKKAMNSKSYFINASGKNIRYVENEAIQTFYTLTKEPKGTVRELSEEDKKYFVELKPEDITFSKLVEWFGDTVNMETEDNKEVRATNIKKSKYNPTDTLTITHKEYPLVEGTVQTTLGRLIYNKLIVEGVGLFDVLGYVNYVLDDSGNGKVERAVTTALKDDKMTVDQMYKYVDTRDWLGLQLHGVITTSFTPSIVKVPPSVKKLKKELLVKYKDGLAQNDPQVSEKMEKELIAATKEAFKDDIGMDLYVSGARGSIGNNYKNMYLMRGAIKNTVNDSFDVITNSLLDGLEKKSIAPHSNSILAGA
jgi:DNA-directed RNA polymerase beta' subunit